MATLITLLVASIMFQGHTAFADISFAKGDVISFLGDSNTMAGGYVKSVESHLLKNYKKLNLKVINAGVGGDTAEFGYKRLERDIFAKNSSVVFVVFGINDIAWGNDQGAVTRERHLYFIKNIVADCLNRGLRVFVLSYPMTNDPLDKTSKNPLTGEVTRTSESYLQVLGRDAMKLSLQLGGGAVDVESAMRARMQTQTGLVRVTQADGVHLNQLGHAWLAEAIIRSFTNSVNF